MEFSGLLDVDGLFKWNDIFTPAVQQPWQIRQVSNLWVQIPRLNRDYLFQRTAKSARSSCFRIQMRIWFYRERLSIWIGNIVVVQKERNLRI